MEIVVAADDGTKTYDVTATRAGRRVETTWSRGIVEVVEVTRSEAPGEIASSSAMNRWTWWESNPRRWG